MLVYPDGEILGTVGGGLLEAKVRQEALRCMQERTSRLLKLELDQTTSGIGVLCGGKAEVFVEPILPVSSVFIKTPAEIALSIMAEIVAYKYRRTPEQATLHKH